MLELKNICYQTSQKIGEEKEILKNINLSFEKGRIYVVTGPNGSGKSTLAKSIIGINKISSGEILFDGKVLNNLSITDRAKLGISFAFQKPVVFKGITIRKLINLASGNTNNVGDACEYLSMVGLCAKDYLDRPFDDKLSGGEQKRIELALTLARKGKVNIFDEPEAGIDIWSFEKLTNLFKNMPESINIIISHQKKILEIADEVILLEKGEVARQGSFEEMAKYLKSSSCARLGGQNE